MLIIDSIFSSVPDFAGVLGASDGIFSSVPDFAGVLRASDHLSRGLRLGVGFAT